MTQATLIDLPARRRTVSVSALPDWMGERMRQALVNENSDLVAENAK